MNLGIAKRAFDRHTGTKNRPAYERFLADVDARPGVWKATQREIAAWWESRQAAAIDLRVASPGTLRVSCALADAAIEMEGGELRTPPFDLSLSTEIPAGELAITYRCAPGLETFAREALGHAGLAHLRPAAAGSAPDIDAAALDPVLSALRATAIEHQAFRPDDVAALRELAARAHRARGAPGMRLWTLPWRGGAPCRVALSPRFDVDKAIVNMPLVHAIEARHGTRSTAYVRPMGLFYGSREIRRYAAAIGDNEIALHGEFATTARLRFGDEFAAAAGEKTRLEFYLGRAVDGVCMHGGELTENYSANSRAAVERAGFRYETMWRNGYYLPLHLPDGDGVYRCLSIGQHWADLIAKPGSRFVEELCAALAERFAQAERMGGVFVPVWHPLYFDIGNYLRYPENLARIGAFLPKYVVNVARMKKGASYRER